jgi:glucosamine 6-phosphate synthetase-like amidotransferase/phosphosugar isomerase protein
VATVSFFPVFYILGLTANESILQNAKHLIIAACGTSYFAGLYGAHIMRALNSFETIQGRFYLCISLY